MTQTLEQPILDRASHPNSYYETMIVSAGAPIVLSVWPGDPGSPTVVFLPGTMTHPLFYEEFLEAAPAGLAVVGVHYQGHGKSPRLGSRLGWANLVANAADAVDWAADHLDGPVVLLGSSQGGVRGHGGRRPQPPPRPGGRPQPARPVPAGVADQPPAWLAGRRLPAAAGHPAAGRPHRPWSCRCRSGRIRTWIGRAASRRPAGGSRPTFGAALLPAGVPGRAVHHGPVGDG